MNGWHLCTSENECTYDGRHTPNYLVHFFTRGHCPTKLVYSTGRLAHSSSHLTQGDCKLLSCQHVVPDRLSRALHYMHSHSACIHCTTPYIAPYIACSSCSGSTTGEGDDSATLMTTPWRHMRRAVLKRNTVPEFAFRQYLFAAQSRLLLRMGRPLDTAERGIRFIGFMGQVLEQHLAVHPQLPGFKEVRHDRAASEMPDVSYCTCPCPGTIAAATRELPDSDADGSSTSGSLGGAAAAGFRAGHHSRVASNGSLSSLYTSSSSSGGMVPVRTAVINPAQEGGEGGSSGAHLLRDTEATVYHQRNCLQV
eukprot:1158303-Pelagomonas_calceolata.AAC.4